MLTVEIDPVYKPTPESSPELTKKSWFGSLMASEKDETFTILITGKPLSTVKADLIHALLSVSKNARCVHEHLFSFFKKKTKCLQSVASV
jgi:BR serine/threonine kinase